ncbi:putative isomerase YbhE [Pterulicium gracile]|uniref:Putative isomerase YbhE n=1 Tax=Pterulicium gracile TaxID=1884261 RepID=A0A5C3QMF4_9AGAR|nr:putative isomerase YbhE [Pterula gracilis]
MVKFRLYAGGWTAFIVSYLFDSETNQLTLESRSPTGPSPSWLSLHPSDPSVLYTTNEYGPVGALQSFRIAENGTLSLGDTTESGGNGPTYTERLSTGEVTALNYGSPSFAIIPTSPDDPLQFSSDYRVVNVPVGAGQTSHPHHSLEYKDELLVADLGMNTVWRVARDGKPGYWKIHGRLDSHPGAGPRHVAVIDDILFTMHEHDNTLTARTIGAPGEQSPILDTVTITPPTSPEGSVFAAAEILIPPKTDKFPTQHIYVSNRNIGVTDPKGDTIAIYSFDAETGKFTETAQVYTQLDQIRGMMFGQTENGGDEFIAASANVVAQGETIKGGTIILKRVDGGANLEIVARNKDELTRTSLVWL